MTNNRKEVITEVAFLLALKNGFNNVSIKEIQKASGFSAGSIYYYFQDKNEILLHMVNVYLIENFYKYREAIRNSNLPFIEKIENIFYYLLGFNKKELNSSHYSTMTGCDNREYFGLFSSIFHQHPETRPIFYKLHKESYDFYKELVQVAVENKEIKYNMEIETLATFIHTIFKGYIDLCIFHPDLSIEELVEVNLKMIRKMT
jgi:AcrR family transcriptional regulator